MKMFNIFSYLRCNSRGVTLVELLAVIVILGILASIAIIAVGGIIENSKVEVCQANRLELERMYHSHLDLEGEEHTEGLFVRYLEDYFEEICPVGGEIKYVNGHIDCSVHPNEIENNDSDDDNADVPYL